MRIATKIERIEREMAEARAEGRAPMVRTTLDDGCIVEVVVQDVGGTLVPVAINDGEVSNELAQPD